MRLVFFLVTYFVTVTLAYAVLLLIKRKTIPLMRLSRLLNEKIKPKFLKIIIPLFPSWIYLLVSVDFEKNILFGIITGIMTSFLYIIVEYKEETILLDLWRTKGDA
jgi:hypothetical protein